LLTDYSFAQGKLGFWTKSDSVSHFADLRVEYTPIEPLARALVRQMQAKYPRLLGLDLYSTTSKRSELHVVASADPEALGRAGGKVEKDVVAREKIYYGRVRKKALVTMPLRDRNGDPVGAVRFTMEAFFGQTEQNALGRAMPILRDMQNQITTLKELTE
jgi:hypothetical protein